MKLMALYLKIELKILLYFNNKLKQMIIFLTLSIITHI